MKIISNIIIIILAILVISFYSCSKDEPIKQTEPVENVTQAAEIRTGGHVNIFTDSTGVFFNTNPADTTQRLVNLRNVDSILYVSPPPYNDVLYLGTYCWEYDITFYSGDETFTRRSFAKYRGTTYKQYPGALEGHSDNRFYEDLIRMPNTMLYFDYGCTKDKRMHLYKKRIRAAGQTFMKEEYIPSGNCNTQIVQLRKLFKR